MAEEGIAEALRSVAVWLKYLGNGNAGTQMGAIENLAKEIKESADMISTSLDGVSEAIRECGLGESLEAIAANLEPMHSMVLRLEDLRAKVK